MAQIPEKGPLKRDTLVSDYTIEHLSVSVTNTETGRFEFAKQHKFLPVVVFNNLTNESNYHNNIYLTELTNAGQWATGSITISGGTTSAVLNGDTFTLTDKLNTSQVFTFNNTDDVVTGGSIGLSTATNESEILSRTKSSINNVGALQISAGSITAGAAVKSSATDILSLGIAGGTSGTSDGDEFTINVPAAIGGSGTAITVRMAPNLVSSPGAGQVFVVRANSNDTNRNRVVAAFNGTGDPSFDATKIEYGSGVTGGTTGIQGVDATNGADAALVSLEASQSGIEGNSIAVNNSVGTIKQSVAFAGGATTQTLEVVQGLTGSAGNTVIDMSGVTGGSSVNFANGNNYGSGSFASNETFTGTLKMRAVSLQREQKF